MAKYFDIHNHLFNKNFLAKELLYRLMKELKNLIHPEFEEENKREIRDKKKKIKGIIKTLKRFSYAMKVFTKHDSTAIYKELNKTYKGEFILTPLTFDLTYCFAPSADRDVDTTDTVKKVFQKEMNNTFDEIEKETRSLSRDFNDRTSREENETWNEYLKAKEQFFADADILQQQHETNVSRQAVTRGKVKLPDAFDGFEEQIEQLKELKAHPEYKDMIFPFLAVDPRRKGIEEYAKQNVGKGKLFVGVKLYCPNGYSPTDPLLYGSDGERGGIYAFCEDNGIPITAHNSDGGFATLSKSVDISGAIYVNGVIRQLKNERLSFGKRIIDKGGVYERAVTLNHPQLWRMVVEKYPKLILNLAHFGGGKQLEAAIKHPEDQKLWSNNIIELVKDSRYKVYTDLSCFSDFNTIREFSKSTIYQKIKHRVLYGSDFILLLLFENNFTNNVEQFKTIFDTDFDVIAGDNPREFLKYVL